LYLYVYYCSWIVHFINKFLDLGTINECGGGGIMDKR